MIRPDRRAFLSGSCAWSLASALPPRPDFRPTLGCTGGLSRAKALAAAGGAYLEVNCGRQLIPDRSEAEFEAKLTELHAAPLPARAANSFLPGRLQCTGPNADHDSVLAYAAIVFQRAKRAGIDTITFGSSGARSLPDGFDIEQARLQFTALLARMVPLTEAHDVTVSVEPLRRKETNFLNRVSEALGIVRAVDHPRVRITADFYHMLCEGESPASLTAAGTYVHHVHVAEKRKRTAPGTDGDDFRPYLRALAQTGFSGRISIESGWAAFDQEIGPALSELRAQVSDVS